MPWGIDELAEELKIKIRDVREHLGHIARSHRIHMEPAVCKHCGFELMPKNMFRPPGRCPKCKSERIASQRLSIPES